MNGLLDRIKNVISGLLIAYQIFKQSQKDPALKKVLEAWLQREYKSLRNRKETE